MLMADFGLGTQWSWLQAKMQCTILTSQLHTCLGQFQPFKAFNMSAVAGSERPVSSIAEFGSSGTREAEATFAWIISPSSASEALPDKLLRKGETLSVNSFLCKALRIVFRTPTGLHPLLAEHLLQLRLLGFVNPLLWSAFCPSHLASVGPAMQRSQNGRL